MERKNKKLRNRQEKGITLIALVITIIVMLILVAVTIAMAVDGGLFGKATVAGLETNQAVLAEKDLGNGKIKIKEGTKIYEYATIDDYFTNTPSKVYEDGEVEDETPEDKPIEPEIPSKICETCEGSGKVCYIGEEDYCLCEGLDRELVEFVWSCRGCPELYRTRGYMEKPICPNCRKYRYAF